MSVFPGPGLFPSPGLYPGGAVSVLSNRALGLISYLHVGSFVADGLLDGLLAGMLTPAYLLSLVCHGDGGQIGPWEAITDPRVAELWALPYVAQWMGGVMPVRRSGESDGDYTARARLELIHPRGMLRGGQTSIKIITQPFLTGTQLVRVVERPAGDVWAATVLTKTSEIGSNAIPLAAALNDPEIVAAGFKVTVLADDSPLVDEGTRQIDLAAGTATMDNGTFADVT